MTQENTTVIEHRVFQGDYRLLRLSSPVIGPLVKPGQFVHLRVPRLPDAVLRRPFSVFMADKTSLAILYKPVGKGTSVLRSVREGDEINLLGPLGNGFPGLGKSKTPVLVAGGYGNAALYLQAAALPVKGVAFFGGRSAIDVLCVDQFKALGWDVRVTTEDGSLGQKGRVTDALDQWLEEQNENKHLEIFSCGPNAMLRAVGERAIRHGLFAWLSMDRNMACGVGACQACVIKCKTVSGWEWVRCCKGGPVMESRKIVWDE